MDAAEQARFERLYQQHLFALKTQGKRLKTIDAYSRAVRRKRVHFGCSRRAAAIMRLLATTKANGIDPHA